MKTRLLLLISLGVFCGCGSELALGGANAEGGGGGSVAAEDLNGGTEPDGDDKAVPGTDGSAPSADDLTTEDLCADPTTLTAIENPAVTLARAYWEVYPNCETVLEPSGPFYFMFPRPDGATYIVEECEAEGPNEQFFQDSLLCSHADTSAKVDVINSMAFEDAMAISTFLHKHLKFVVVDIGPTSTSDNEQSIDPYPLDRDLIELCNGPAANDLSELCTFLESGSDVGRYFTDSELNLLPGLLNELYGID